jgi:hypothetical protein
MGETSWHAEQDCETGTTKTGLLVQICPYKKDSQNRTTRTGLQVQICQYKTASTGLPGQDYQDRTPVQDCQNMTVWTG